MDDYEDPLDDPIFGKSATQTDRLKTERESNSFLRRREEQDLVLAVQEVSFECYEDQRLG